MTSGAVAVPGRVDVMVPFYGDPALLRLAVDSVLAQTSPLWRLVVVDDCCPAGPEVATWIEELADPRVSYVRNEANLGVAGNFQRCLDLATADHVTFLGCDDLLLPRYVELVGRAARRSGAAMTQPTVRVVDANGEVSRSQADEVKRLLAPQVGCGVTLRGQSLARSLLLGNWTYFPAICWRREVIAARGFRQDLGIALDLELILDLVAHGESLVLLAEEAFVYRRHAASESSVAAGDASRFTEERELSRELAATMSGLGWSRAARAARMRPMSRLHAASLLPGAVRARRFDAAGSLLRHACR